MDSETAIFVDADGHERTMEIVDVAGRTAPPTEDRQKLSFSDSFEVRDAKTDLRFPLILEDASFFDETGKQWKRKAKQVGRPSSWLGHQAHSPRAQLPGGT